MNLHCRKLLTQRIRSLSTTPLSTFTGDQNLRFNSGDSQALFLQTHLQKCAKNLSLLEGKSCHAQLIELGFNSETLICNILINMYCKCGLTSYARKVFDKMPERNFVSWNTIIGAYTKAGDSDEAFELFVNMRKDRNSISEFAVSSVLCACAAKGDVFECRQLHAFAVKTAVFDNVFVATALLDVYSKCGLVKEASVVFDCVEEKSEVTWSSMVAGFVRNECYEEALCLYRRTLVERVLQNQFTISSVISACAQIAALVEGKQVHSVVCKVGFSQDVFVASSLVDMYAKCGCIEEGYRVFSEQGKKSMVLWNAVVSGFAKHGASLEARILFEKMQQMGFSPDDVTYVSMLSVCAHKGLVNEGRAYFGLMVKEHNVRQNVLHYSCLVDILGRSGSIEEAYGVIKSMPFDATVSMWGSFLGSCRKFGNVKLAEIAAKKLFEIEPQNAGNHILMVDIYSANKKWDEAAQSRKFLRESLAKKERGKSWIQVKDKVHKFMVGERNHPRIVEIYSKLDELVDEMRESGYEVMVENDFHDVERGEKEELLRHHGEKLAVVFGLMALAPGVPIRVMKNLRICGDCHLFMKYASRVRKREIIVRDVNRFHHFRNGDCSCGDFW